MTKEDIEFDINYHEEGINFMKNYIQNIRILIEKSTGKEKRDLKEEEKHVKKLINKKQEKVIKLRKKGENKDGFRKMEL